MTALPPIVPTLNLSGGPAAPSEATSGATAGGGTGDVVFSDGSFQVGGSGNGAETSEPVTVPSAGEEGGPPLSSLGSTSASSDLTPILLIGGAVVLWLMFRKKL